MLEIHGESPWILGLEFTMNPMYGIIKNMHSTPWSTGCAFA